MLFIVVSMLNACVAWFQGPRPLSRLWEVVERHSHRPQRWCWHSLSRLDGQVQHQLQHWRLHDGGTVSDGILLLLQPGCRRPRPSIGRLCGKGSLGHMHGTRVQPGLFEPAGFHDPPVDEQQAGARRLQAVDHLPRHALHQSLHGPEVPTPFPGRRVYRPRLCSSKTIPLQVRLLSSFRVAFCLGNDYIIFQNNISPRSKNEDAHTWQGFKAEFTQ